MPTSQNRVIFEHTLAGSKNLLRIKPVRSDGIDTSFTDFVDIIAGDISDVDLLSDQGATYSGFVTENSIGGVITGFTPAEDLLQIEWYQSQSSILPVPYAAPTLTSLNTTETFPGVPGEVYNIYARTRNKFGYISDWEEIYTNTIPSSIAENLAQTAIDEFGNQIGINLLKNWSFEQYENLNGEYGDALNWSTSPPVGSDISILRSYEISAANLSSIHGDRTGMAHNGIIHNGSWTPLEVTTNVSDYITKMPSTSSYTLKFAATYGLYPNSLITNTSFDSYLPNPIKVKAVIYEYNSWDAKTAYITLQESTFYSLPSSNTLQEIEYTFSNFNMNCKSFRVGFIYSSYNSLDESDFGLTSFTGIFLVNIDMVSLFTGTIIGGYGPFILTEDTQSADIAEKYISLDGVSSGDLVCFGDPVKGKPSIKKAKKEDMDGRPLMIVSSNYFFTLKDEYSKEPGYGSASIALKGRVPCNIIGPISINDPISLYDDGTGKKASPGEIIVGHAITEHRGTGTGQVLVFIK